MKEWNEIEIDFGEGRMRFVRDLPPANDPWKDAKDWASAILEEKIEKKIRDVFLVFSEGEKKKLIFLREWIGRKYRYFIWGGLLRIFLVDRTGGKVRLFQVKGQDVLGLFSDGNDRFFRESGFVNGTAIFPAYYEDVKLGRENRICIMLRVIRPSPEYEVRKKTSVPIIQGGREIAQGHFAEEGYRADISCWPCEVICEI